MRPTSDVFVSRAATRFASSALCSALVLLVACDDAGRLSDATQSQPAPAIVLGADGVGTDRADYDCKVALVSAGRVADGRGGYEVDCSSGGCRWRIVGELRVGKGAEGTPHVLFQTTESGRWMAVEAAPSGVGRFRFEFSDGTPRPDYSGTALARAKVSLIPYLLLDDGGRLFDHNRLLDPFASYELTVGNGFAIASDDACTELQRLAAPGPSDPVVNWAGEVRLYRARAGDSLELAEPFAYQGFSNMGFAIEARVYAEGLTANGWVDTSTIKVFFESDLMTCDPGGELAVVEVPLALGGGGPFGNDAIYRQPVESALTRCPRGTYRHRFLVSADGGKTALPLGLGVDIHADAAAEFRTIVYR